MTKPNNNSNNSNNNGRDYLGLQVLVIIFVVTFKRHHLLPSCLLTQVVSNLITFIAIVIFLKFFFCIHDSQNKNEYNQKRAVN